MIDTKNATFDQSVICNRGILPVSSLLPGDKLIEYKTNKALTVKEVIRSDKAIDVYKVTYNDKRVEFYSINDYIHIGYSIIPIIRTMINHPDKPMRFGYIKQYPVVYDNIQPFQNPLNPDPYIAGALLIHGNLDDEYINLPLDRDAANNLFANKYNLEYGSPLGDSRTFYHFLNDEETELITWEKFFNNANCYAVNKLPYSPIIPISYWRSSINSRWQFIRGAFDIGYESRMFPDSVGMAARDENRLELVQKMLHSLGILSKISYDPNLPVAVGREYRLDLVGRYENYMGMFYDIDAMENTLENITNGKNIFRSFKLHISSIEHAGQKFVSKLVLNKSRAIYLSSNFIPRLSE